MIQKEINKNQRIEYIDALKGVAIFFVLWGHSVQYLKNGYDFFQNPIFEFIYSFHMSLFFIISGFFFRSSLKLNIKDFFFKKSIQLLLPCAVWSVIIFLIGILIIYTNGSSPIFNNWMEIPKKLLYGALEIWFLKELFSSYSIVFITLKVFKNKWLACILSISFVLISPYLCGIQRVFLPVFWAGIFLKDYYHIFSKYAKQALIILGSVFAIGLMFWNGNYTMYVTVFPSLINFTELRFNFTNIDISIFRLLIGICGSLFFFTLLELVYSNNRLFGWFSKVGVNTLAIYLLQRLLIENWANDLIDFPNMNIWIYNLLITPLISLLSIWICGLIIKSVQKNKYADLILFGKDDGLRINR